MSFFTSKFDAQVSIFKLAGSDNLTGFSSSALNIPVKATGKTITGFKFDEAFWRADTEENNAFIQPTLWDPNALGMATFQIGIGDNEDLLIEDVIIEYRGSDGEDELFWCPRIFHGFYYGREDEWFFYSDDGLTDYPSQDQIWVSNINTTISGGNYVDLEFNPKPGIPILARDFTWNKELGFYQVARSAHKVLEFTPLFTTSGELTTQIGDEILWDNVSLGDLEFVLMYNSSPPQVVFNQQVVIPVGKELTTLSGFSTAEIEAIELVGTTLAQDFQEHHLKFAPVDRTLPVQVVVDNGIVATEYSVVTEFTISGINEVMVDYDLGILRFGSSDQGGRPPLDYNIRAYYHRTLALEYEPEYSRDYFTNANSNINPITRFNADGFVLIREAIDDPYTLSLSAELSTINNNYFGPLYLGNAFSRIFAEVRDAHNNPVEGQEVFFELLTPYVGSFGLDTSSSAITNSNGIAKTLYNPPRTIADVGGVTNVINTISGNSQLFIENYTPSTNEDTLFLFQIHATDNILGIPKADLLEYYENYIAEQGSLPSGLQTQGPQVGINIGSLGDYDWITGAYEDFIKWEILHRAYHNLLTPVTYETDDLITGKKTVVATLDSNAINPHTGTTPAIVPVQPTDYTIVSSGVYVDFDVSLPAISSLYKAYMIVGPTKASIRAYTVNPRTNQIIYSNTIDVLIDIPDSGKGLFYIDTINSLPSGVLGNALFHDQFDLELESVNITTSGLLPIGWRIRSTGITLASALDSITFLDLNPLTEPDDTISHEFIVEV